MRPFVLRIQIASGQGQRQQLAKFDATDICGYNAEGFGPSSTILARNLSQSIFQLYYVRTGWSNFLRNRMLSQLPRRKSVYSKFECIVAAGKQIVADINEYHAKSGKQVTVTADELLPLMAYVLIKVRQSIFSLRLRLMLE